MKTVVTPLSTGFESQLHFDYSEGASWSPPPGSATTFSHIPQFIIHIHPAVPYFMLLNVIC
jgi:hypothetical protein